MVTISDGRARATRKLTTTAIPRVTTQLGINLPDLGQHFTILRRSISLRDFYFLNPSINISDCLNLWLETSYCVKAVGDINTYKGYPYSTSPIYTLTSPNYVTTTVALINTVKPIVTPILELPLAPGSLTEDQGCLEFANYRVVTPQRDQPQQRDVPAFTNTINNRDFVSASFGVLKTFSLGIQVLRKGNFVGFKKDIGTALRIPLVRSAWEMKEKISILI